MGGKAVILIIFSVFTIFPFIWMIISALKTKQEIMDVSSFFPETFQWQNFVSVFTDSPLMRYVGNSLYISVFTLLIQIITGAMIAYAIVFLTFKGRGVLFGIIMCTYMVPTAATYIPSYIILSDMKLLDTFTGLIISNCVSIFGIFLLRQEMCIRDRFGNEPCGFEGGHSVIDMGCMPALVTPNEFRDGVMRAMD